MSSKDWLGFHRSALAVAVAIVAAAPAMAQNTTSAIGGRVTAADGKPVVGATVVILHKESGSTNTQTTDAEGRYNARGLRVGGPYTITVSKGNDREVRNDVYLALAETLSLDLRLGAQQLAAVEVSGSSVASKFNSGTMGAGTQIGRAELDAYASIARSLQDYARTDPRLAQTDKERGEISAAGQNTRYNSITIDGVAINDTFGLESNNLPTAKQPISIDAVQSVQVNLSNYDVTQKGYTGANINAVTKSGTNELKGSVYYVYRDDSMVGQKYDRKTGAYFDYLPFKEDTKGFTLGGPIVKDKLFFFVNYEELKSNRAQPEFGPIGSALPASAHTQSSIDSLNKIAKEKYGFVAGNPLGDSNLTVKDYLAKLDWTINDRHRANLRIARTEQSDTNNGSFSGYTDANLQLSSQWWQQKKKIDTVVAQWFADWTDDFSTEFKVSTRDYNSVPLNAADLPAMSLRMSGALPDGAPKVSGNRFLNFGTERSRHFNVLDTKTIDAYLGATWIKGDHELKFGGDLQRNKVYNAFFQNTKGNYTFGCESSVASGKPTGWNYNTLPGGSIDCAKATAAQVEAAVLENFLRGRPSSYQVQTAANGSTFENGAARWTLSNAGLFLQDTWTVNDALTLTGGFRVDRMATGDKPTYNAAAAAATVAGSVNGTTVVRNTGGFGLDNSQTVDGETLFQPRLGFNWTLDNRRNAKKQLRGGVGLFQGAAANVWISNPYSNTGLATAFYGCGSSGFASCDPTKVDGLFNPDPNKQPTNLAGTPAANVDFLQKGLGQPSVWKLNLAYDAELPWYGMVFGAEWMHTRVNTGVYYQHLNLGAATRKGLDGRDMFYTPQSYTDACWNPSGSLVTSGACAGGRARALSNASYNNVLQATKTKKGDGNTLTLSLSRPARDGFGWSLAYTYTEATEVSPLTSSVSNSNFESRSIYNPNEDVAANSAYLIRDRISASFNWSKAFISNYRTTVGLFYEGRRGKPYSWTYLNDMNGDGVSSNDLMYIPKGPGSGEVVFKSTQTGESAAAAEARFWDIVNSNKQLANSKGSVVARNSSYAPFVNTFDLRLSQEVPGFFPGHKGKISFDILNFGNLLNKNWGRINEMKFENSGGFRRGFVNFAGIDAQGRYVYAVDTNGVTDYTQRQVKGESQWALQITAKYEF
ncbi:carboxypeptidase-like regulatory domain-containing protein [Pelomonas sp. CA6]|uniref:TonB-dependent receptor n=1 Tax=Pelomonas sp. CA6 TaxID=2907999 RepID=UPI001F4A4F03|nr:carboxypeptidase-like regulatory domain-containing protein [Pelomonas sp. CA6]MCH7342607.1 carboxypeptidase-like regulatory domain-containing protein [Pelomonas sp. CA6]